jgi:hypothetical protein
VASGWPALTFERRQGSAARILAEARVQSARGQIEDARRAQEHEQ